MKLDSQPVAAGFAGAALFALFTTLLGAQGPKKTCLPTIADQSVPGACLTAASFPTLGALYPLGPELNIDSAGRVGVGTSSPSEQLSVAGVIHTESGGLRFPDGSLQTTAAGPSFDGSVKAAIHHDGNMLVRYFSTLGDGTVTVTYQDGDETILDFGVDVRERYFVATAAEISGPTDNNLAVEIGTSNDPGSLQVRFTGDGFYLLVY